MAKFELVSDFAPTGDQPHAIDTLASGIENGLREQVLKGVTGSGKTFTIANVIKKTGKKALVLEPNKTLAGQMYSELKAMFPNNHVCYFISYYDYYQPEAYVVTSDTYIEKDARINEEIDEMRHNATSSLIDYDDVIIVASVSCIYSIGSKEDYVGSMMTLRSGEEYDRKELIERLVTMQYTRNEIDFQRGSFRVHGDTLEIIPASEHKNGIRVEFFDDEIERIRIFDVITGKAFDTVEYVNIFSATHFVTSKDKLEEALKRIRAELKERVKYFNDNGKPLESERIEQRTTYDLEMLEQMGTCNGVENYSRHMALREEGETPSTLIDFFDKDFVLFIDESHVTVPQIRGMYNGDRARKTTLVDYGFRLPSALDNRPLKFDEFEQKLDQVVYVSATPGDYEVRDDNPIVEQIIRPTGLLDPEIVVRPTMGQIDDLYNEIVVRAEKGERVLVTTLTIKMSEDLTAYFKQMGLRVAYLHSEIKALQRLEILRDLRLGKYDCLVGINLLREGLDLPEVSLVAILDADKMGFLRSTRSLIQIIGRAARNSEGKVIMYADSISDSMKEAMDETSRRRAIQMKYNKDNNITPRTIIKDIRDSVTVHVDEALEQKLDKNKLSKAEKAELILQLEDEMKQYAADLNFEMAAQVRDVLLELKGELK
ncbi:MAG: excinuclease ABC subunit UvrB [Acholeplasmatales bacterium]|nr:excinuclease ABC subunit UvrB [Acholeplasmatales bacterium]